MVTDTHLRGPWALTALLLAMNFGCSGDPTPPMIVTEDARPSAEAGPQSLRLRPSEAVVHLMPSGPEPVSFNAVFTAVDGRTVDITTEATFEVRPPSLGEFRGSTFYANEGRSGRGIVQATYGEWFGRAEISVSEVFFREGVDDTELPLFAPDAPAAIEPNVDHPSAEALLPINLYGLQWVIQTQRHHTFELRFTGPDFEAREYFRCAPVEGPCVHPIGEDLWERIAAPGHAGNEIEYQVRARGAGSRQQVGASATQTFRLSSEPIQGGIYFWEAESGDILRHEFGSRVPIAEPFLDGLPGSPHHCVGCHEVSRDGTNIGVQVRSPDTANPGFASLTVADRTPLFYNRSSVGGRITYPSFSPDGATLVNISGDQLIFRDARTGELEGSFTIPEGSMPSYSPTGNEIAFSRYGGLSGTIDPGRRPRGISVLREDSTGWRLQRDVLPADNPSDLRSFDPQWSPDGEWILVTRTSDEDGAYGAPPGEIWLVSASGDESLPLIDERGARESWPRWDRSEYRQGEERLFWFVYSSRRTFGGQEGAAQLWMRAVWPETADGEPPRLSAPFRLPFQSTSSQNLMGQLVTEIARQPCDEMNPCPDGEVCRDGRCMPLLE